MVKERDQIKAKLAEEKYKPGLGGKMAAACLAGLQEELAKERAKQTKISSELEKEQKASRDHKRASAELSFGERRLTNARAKQAQASANLKKVEQAKAKATAAGDEAGLAAVAAAATQAEQDAAKADKEASELMELVAKAKVEYVKTEQEIMAISKGEGLMSKEEVTDVDIASVVSRQDRLPRSHLYPPATHTTHTTHTTPHACARVCSTEGTSRNTSGSRKTSYRRLYKPHWYRLNGGLKRVCIRSTSNHIRVFRRSSNHIRVFRPSSNHIRRMS